jgi:hypothetical protein
MRLRGFEGAVAIMTDQRTKTLAVVAHNGKARLESAFGDQPSEAILALVRALARAAAVSDYEHHRRLSDASSDHEGWDIRKV